MVIILANYVLKPIIEKHFDITDPVQYKKVVYIYIAFAIITMVIYYFVLMPYFGLSDVNI